MLFLLTFQTGFFGFFGKQRQQFFIVTGANHIDIGHVIDLSQSPQQYRHRNLSFAIHLHGQHVSLACLKLQPGSTAGDKLRHTQFTPSRTVFFRSEVHARRPDQLADNDTLGTVDHEGTVFRHLRKIPHEHRLFLDFPRVFVHKSNLHPQRTGISHVSLTTHLLIVLWFSEPEIPETQFEALVEALDGRYFFKKLTQPLTLEPTKRIQLNFN